MRPRASRAPISGGSSRTARTSSPTPSRAGETRPRSRTSSRPRRRSRVRRTCSPTRRSGPRSTSSRGCPPASRRRSSSCSRSRRRARRGPPPRSDAPPERREGPRERRAESDPDALLGAIARPLELDRARLAARGVVPVAPPREERREPPVAARVLAAAEEARGPQVDELAERALREAMMAAPLLEDRELVERRRELGHRQRDPPGFERLALRLELLHASAELEEARVPSVLARVGHGPSPSRWLRARALPLLKAWSFRCRVLTR